MKFKKMFEVLVLIIFLYLKPVTMATSDTYPDYNQCTTLLSRYDPQVLSIFQMEMSQGIERFFLLSYCLACCWPASGAKNDLRVVRQWAELEFVFPNEGDMMRAIDQNYYIPGKSVPLDVDVQHRQGSSQSRIFVTVPRFEVGRPITLGTVDSQGKINAYPDYSWHDQQGLNCNGLTSVFRTAIDECQRLWVMDTGKIGDTQYCPPKLVAFDLATDKRIYEHIVSNSSYTEASLFITPVVDIRPRSPGDCAFTYVYVADVSGFGILVVDVLRDRSWRVTHRLFFPYPSRGTFTIAGETFDLMDGIFGMALSPYKEGQERYLYFHALASTTENVISTNLLRNDSYQHNTELGINDVYVYPGQRPTQSAAEATDRNGIMFFGLMDPPSIACWNTAKEFSSRNIHTIARDNTTLQFASGVKIINNAKGEQELWVFTSRFQKVMTGTLSSSDVNFRILAEKTSTLLQGSPCRVAHHKGSGHY